MELQAAIKNILFPQKNHKLQDTEKTSLIFSASLIESEKRKYQHRITSLTTIRLSNSFEWHCFQVEISPKFLTPDEPKVSLVVWSSPQTSKGGPGCYEITAHPPKSGPKKTIYIGMSTRPVSKRCQEEFIAAARGYGSQKSFSLNLRKLAKEGYVFQSHQIADMTGASRETILAVEKSFINWEVIHEENDSLLNTVLPAESECFLRGELTPPRKLSTSQSTPKKIGRGGKARESRVSTLKSSGVRKKLDFSSCEKPTAPEYDKLPPNPVLDWTALSSSDPSSHYF